MRWAAGAILALLTGAAFLHRPVRIEPSSGTPSRIVSLVPSLTECLFAAGGGDLLVGRSRFCDHPPEALAAPVVGDVIVDPESVVALDPDLVLSSRSLLAGANERLRQEGIRVVEYDVESVAGVADVIRDIGRRIGRAREAEHAAREFLARIEAVRRRPRSGRRIYVEFSTDPRMTAGRGMYLHEVIEAAGGVNVFGDREGWAQVDAEEVVARRPDIVLVMHGLPAACDGARVVHVEADIFLRAGPRLADAAERLYDLLNAPP
jgi:iron complex transport system substrate-binding protein